jgi:hypothetical protein
MTICGNYKQVFRDATHCLFNGNLNDIYFRKIAIQRILKITKNEVTLSESGTLKIKKKDGREYVSLTYPGIFGNQRTTGHPFYDKKYDVGDERGPGID